MRQASPVCFLDRVEILGQVDGVGERLEFDGLRSGQHCSGQRKQRQK
jgi:hypothetical protein